MTNLFETFSKSSQKNKRKLFIFSKRLHGLHAFFKKCNPACNRAKSVISRVFEEKIVKVTRLHKIIYIIRKKISRAYTTFIFLYSVCKKSCNRVTEGQKKPETLATTGFRRLHDGYTFCACV